MDYLTIGRSWSGALNEDEFLGRLYPLAEMESTDKRKEYNNAQLDIWKHRVVNSDWRDDWVFTDPRFDLLHGPDERFLVFLAETVHPVVRPDIVEALSMVEEYNRVLAVDGWEIHKKSEISQRPVFGWRMLITSSAEHMAAAEHVAERLGGTYVAQQIGRLRQSLDKDPAAAIGEAKDFLETVCKTILAERGVESGGHLDLPALVKKTASSLQVLPPEVAADPRARASVTGMVTSLAVVARHAAEIRNAFGTGHGKRADHAGLNAKHARLVLGAVSTVAAFLYDCHVVQAIKTRT